MQGPAFHREHTRGVDDPTFRAFPRVLLLTLLARIGVEVQVVVDWLALPLRGLSIQGVVSPSSHLCPLLVNRQELLEIGVFLQLVAPEQGGGKKGKQEEKARVRLTSPNSGDGESTLRVHSPRSLEDPWGRLGQSWEGRMDISSHEKTKKPWRHGKGT